MPIQSPQKMDHLRDFIQPSNVKLVGADHQKLLQNFNALPISSSAKSPCCRLWQVVARLLLPHLQREPAISGLSSSTHPTTSNALLFIHNPVTETATWRRPRPSPSAARPRQGISAHKRQEREEDWFRHVYQQAQRPGGAEGEVPRQVTCEEGEGMDCGEWRGCGRRCLSGGTENEDERGEFLALLSFRIHRQSID